MKTYFYTTEMRYEAMRGISPRYYFRSEIWSAEDGTHVCVHKVHSYRDNLPEDPPYLVYVGRRNEWVIPGHLSATEYGEARKNGRLDVSFTQEAPDTPAARGTRTLVGNAYSHKDMFTIKK